MVRWVFFAMIKTVRSATCTKCSFFPLYSDTRIAAEAQQLLKIIRSHKMLLYTSTGNGIHHAALQHLHLTKHDYEIMGQLYGLLGSFGNYSTDVQYQKEFNAGMSLVGRMELQRMLFSPTFEVVDMDAVTGQETELPYIEKNIGELDPVVRQALNQARKTFLVRLHSIFIFVFFYFLYFLYFLYMVFSRTIFNSSFL